MNEHSFIPESVKGLLRPIGDLKPYPGNPRVIPDKAIDAVAASIANYGFWQPIVVSNNDDCIIVAGHTRYAASLKLGIKEVPVISMEGMPPETVRMYRLSDNRTNQMTTWDYDDLKIELLELQEGGFEPIGFDQELLALNNPDYSENSSNSGENGADSDEKPETCPTCGQPLPAD